MQKLEQSEFDYAKFLQAIEGKEIRILEALGLEPDNQGNVRCACPIHGGDNVTAFKYTDELKIWKCFTNKCDNEFGCSLIGLVKGIKKVGFVDALNFIERTLDFKLDKSDIVELERNSYIRKSKNKVEVEEKVFSEQVLEKVKFKSPYFENLGFLPSTFDKFEIFEVNNPGKPLNNRAVATIRNVDGNIIGFTGRIRALEPAPGIPKWLHQPAAIKTQKHLYGLWNNLEAICQQGAAVIVEGPKDVWRLSEADINIGVGTLGTTLSKDHIKLLLKCGVRRLYILYDPDKGGETGSLKIVRDTKLFFNVFDYRDLLQDDAGDSTVEQLEVIKREIEKA